MSSGRTRQRPPMSSPARGTWIEMHLNAHKSTGVIPSSPARGTWIEIMLYPPPPACGPLSSPARGTWIEIAAGWRDARGCRVVPRKGDVDRNIFHAVNGHGGAGSSPARGTWIEIQGRESKVYGNDGSSPARGTWIEHVRRRTTLCATCASSPARGTWIEMLSPIYNTATRGGRPPQGGRG